MGIEEALLEDWNPLGLTKIHSIPEYKSLKVGCWGN
jgi:hypothetical protein